MTVAADLTYLPWVGPAAGTDAPCVRDERRELSYRDIERAAAAVAEQFAEHGVGRGDVVAVMLPNSVELLVAVLAAWRLGAAATPVNPAPSTRRTPPPPPPPSNPTSSHSSSTRAGRRGSPRG
ncbi:AMP-binding protein [Microbacterium lacticum]|uniref:AMP-binding protein n=1 Tax=Microbacterium lacticum TaxID=33885 RepID=UPI0011686176|nr:AMP-binding protein [Microbacterium lacticum]GEB94581.1 hypothetical protein MLA01_08000 [Microbacterium lacticum]GGN20509.1 hypothetical protein GCM10009724_13330 [Microbacterium lacticum]